MADVASVAVDAAAAADKRADGTRTASGDQIMGWFCTHGSVSGYDCSRFDSSTDSSTESSAASVPQGGSLTVKDDATKTVACNDGNLTVDDISVTVTGHCVKLIVDGNSSQVNVDSADSIDVNGAHTTVNVTGHCGQVTISTGSDNHVTVGSADTIDADGIDNVVIFHSGSPQITNDGMGNTVQQG